jgi:putative ABC transport system permease protein
MFLQYLNILLRRIVKERVFYTIILANLAIGYAVFIMLSQFINGELTWDKHNTNYDRIYRLQVFMDQKENTIKHTWSVPPALSRQNLPGMPEIEKVALMHDVGDNNKNGVFLSVDKKTQFITRYGYYADQSVFDILTFRFTEGDRQKALIQPYSIVLSETLAKKLFPEGNAIGKQVYGENKEVFTVTGIYENIPERSTLRPAFLIPISLIKTLTTNYTKFETDYRGYSFYTYVLLKQNAVSKSVDDKIYSTLKDFRKEHHPYLRPLSKLHTNPYFENNINIAIALFSFISALILLLSSINFINLQTANASTRFREIGIKKAVGFNRNRLRFQFMFESVALSYVAAGIGLVIAQLFFPALNKFLGAELLTGVIGNWKLILIIFVITFITGYLSGIHPAYVISTFNPVAALKQKFIEEKSNGFSLKKVLMTIQFSISVFMLVLSFIVYRQTNYMLTMNLGFESDKVLYSNIVTNKKGSIDPLRQKLLQHSEIADVCVSDYIPYILPGGDDLNWVGSDPNQKVFVRYSNVSYDFVPTFGLKIASGRNFSKDYPADGNKCLINETGARMMGGNDIVGRHLKLYKKDIEIIGVIKDYTVYSAYSPNEPHLYRLIQDSLISNGVYSVRFVKGKEKAAMKIVKEEFEQFFPDDAFEFQNIQNLVQNENAVVAFKSFRKICSFIALLTIIISSIGLFGLILFFTRRKMKEVGIRKVLGFSFGNLYLTLSTGFIKLLLFSILIAWPAAFYVYKVLPGANKYGIQIWEFLLATLIILLVALGTITFQILKAVKVRPVDILKDE